MATGTIQMPISFPLVNNDSSSSAVAGNSDYTFEVDMSSKVPNGYSIALINTVTIRSNRASFAINGYSISNSSKKISVVLRNLTSSEKSTSVRVYAICVPANLYG